MSIVSLLFFLAVAAPTVAFAVSPPGECHPHRGKLKPYPPGPPTLQKPLSEKQLQQLSEGKPVETKLKLEKRDLIIQDVEATPEVIWSQILDYNRYTKLQPDTLESEIYDKSKPDHNKVFFKIGNSKVTFEVHNAITHHRDIGSATWTLDYDRKSDFDDTAGCKLNRSRASVWHDILIRPTLVWHVEKHPEKENASRIYFSCVTSLASWLPSFVSLAVNKQGMRDSVRSSLCRTAAGAHFFSQPKWVKEHSERAMKKKRDKVGM